jgi:hypothetical protein
MSSRSWAPRPVPGRWRIAATTRWIPIATSSRLPARPGQCQLTGSRASRRSRSRSTRLAGLWPSSAHGSMDRAGTCCFWTRARWRCRASPDRGSGRASDFTDHTADPAEILSHGFDGGYVSEWQVPQKISASASVVVAPILIKIVLQFDTAAPALTVERYFQHARPLWPTGLRGPAPATGSTRSKDPAPRRATSTPSSG